MEGVQRYIRPHTKGLTLQLAWASAQDSHIPKQWEGKNNFVGVWPQLS